MPRKFKFDKTRQTIKTKLMKKAIPAQTLEYFVQQNTFDRHQSRFLNYKGFTFVLENPKGDDDDEIHFDIELKYQDTDLQKRLFAMKSEKEIEEINKIKEDYGYY